MKLKQLLFALILSCSTLGALAQSYVPRYELITAAGTDTYTATVIPTPSLQNGFKFAIKFTNANTGAATLNVNSLGAVTLRDKDGNALASGAIPAGSDWWVVYDGTATQWRLLGGGSGGGGGGSLSGLTAATGTNTINNVDYAQEWQWNSLSSNTGLKLSSTSTAAASNSQRIFEVNLSGANATASQTTEAGRFINTHTGTSSTNVAGYFSASGGTNNYAIQIPSGKLNVNYHLTNSWMANIGSMYHQSYAKNNTFITDNMFFNGSGWERVSTGYGAGFQFFNGQIGLQCFDTGAGVASFTRGFKMDYSNRFVFGNSIPATYGDFTGAAVLIDGVNKNLLINGTTITSGSKLDIRAGGTGSNKGFRFADSGNTERFVIHDNGGTLVGTGAITTNAILDVQSTSRASIPFPKMTEAQRDAISSPSAGFTVFNTDTNQPNVYNGTAWGRIGQTTLAAGRIKYEFPWLDASASSGNSDQNLFTTEQDLIINVTAQIIGIKSDGSQGYYAEKSATFRKDGAATAVQVGTTTTIVEQKDDAETTSIAMNSTNVRISYNTGDADTYRWTIFSTITKTKL